MRAGSGQGIGEDGGVGDEWGGPACAVDERGFGVEAEQVVDGGEDVFGGDGAVGDGAGDTV